MERTLTNFGRTFVAMSILVVVSLSISPGHTFETWLGEVSTNVNLRKAPGLDQEIIVVLEEATIVEVLNKSDDWYQVVTLWQTPEQRGWVFGKHLRKTAEKITSSEDSLRTGQEEEKRELSSTLVTPQTAETPSVVEEDLAPAIPEPEATLTELEEPPSVDEDATETVLPLQREQNETPLSEITAPEAFTNEATLAVKSEDSGQEVRYERTRLLLRSFARLASVIISCLALILAFKALRMARKCYQEIAQLQERSLDLPAKEDQTEDA